jgi:hypothetical protein
MQTQFIFVGQCFLEILSPLQNVNYLRNKLLFFFRGEYSLIGLLQSAGKLDEKDTLTLVSDMLLAGIDTTSYTMSFLLFLLSKHQDVQQNLRSQISKGVVKMEMKMEKIIY